MGLLTSTALTHFKVKAVWITLAVLGAIILGQAAYIYVQSGQVALAEAAKTLAEGNLDQANLERDSWKQKVEEAEKAAGSWKQIAQRRAELLAEQQEESMRIGKANRDALAAARDAQMKAEAAKALWRRNYERIIGQPKCAQARAAYDAACPIGAY